MGDKDPHNSKKKPVILQQTHLFDDLIIQEILTRLPVKSILRFKSVSKQWYSTLSSSNFANAHFIKSPFSHPSAPVNTLFIIDLKNCCYLFSYDVDDDDQISCNFTDNLVKLDVDFGVGKDLLVPSGCCNGLICLTPSSSKYFILWNPATRELRKYVSDEYLKHFDKADRFFVTSGFGYTSSVDDYKYVQVLSTLFQGNLKTHTVCVFSLRENKWRKFDFDHDAGIFCREAMLINEKLYWVARSGGDGKIVVSFDLGVERFDLIKVDHAEFELLGVMGGRLSKCNYNLVTGDMLLHILEPPAVVNSIGLPKELGFRPSSQMIGFTRTGKYFTTRPFNDDPRDFQDMLGIVDTRRKPIQYTMLLRFDNMLKIARYVPSLASPYPIEEPSKA